MNRARRAGVRAAERRGELDSAESGPRRNGRDHAVAVLIQWLQKAKPLSRGRPFVGPPRCEADACPEEQVE